MNKLLFKNPHTGNKIQIIRGTFGEFKDFEKYTGRNLFGDEVDAANGTVSLKRELDGSWTVSDHWNFEETGPIGEVLVKAVKAELLKDEGAGVREWIWYDNEYWSLNEGTTQEKRLKEVIDANALIPGWVGLECEVKYKKS